MFEWDDEKDAANRKKHGIGFETAMHVFAGPVLTRADDRKDYGETREISIGALEDTLIIVVIHTDRDGVRRLISARRANKTERTEYHDYCAKIIGQSQA